MKLLYRLYQLLIALPIIIIATTLTAIVTIIGCTFGKARTWGYYPPMVWSRLMCWVMLLPVKVEGRELLDKKQSYVFVANHQGAFDIFLIYGFLGRTSSSPTIREHSTSFSSTASSVAVSAG